MLIGDIIQIIVALSKVRRLFWSEDDFKFAFASQIQLKFGNAAEIRLEKRYKGENGKNSYTDIVVRMGGRNFPIELKYKTAEGSYADLNNEAVGLMTHSAVDLGCYAYLKDINRLEYLAKTDSDFERGFAIILTNEPLYYRDTGRSSVYDAFKIYDGKTVSGMLDWDRSNYDIEKLPSWLKSHPAFELTGSYDMSWRNYGSVLQSLDDPADCTQFKYQIAVVGK